MIRIPQRAGERDPLTEKLIGSGTLLCVSVGCDTLAIGAATDVQSSTSGGTPEAWTLIFTTMADRWPTDLYIDLGAAIGTDWMVDIESGAATVTDSDLQCARDLHKQGFGANLKLSIRDAATLGKVLHAVQVRGFWIWDRDEDAVEIVFRSSITPNLISQIIPLYRTNKQFKRERRQQHDLD